MNYAARRQRGISLILALMELVADYAALRAMGDWYAAEEKRRGCGRKHGGRRTSGNWNNKTALRSGVRGASTGRTRALYRR